MSFTPSNQPALFALVDCNNFYASCERVFNPVLNVKPVVVMSNNDGCVVARSEEAKAVGVGMGVPIFQIQDKIKAHGIEVFSSNYALYGDMSRRVMQTLSLFTPELEIYSIDEAFLNLAGFEERNLSEYAQQIRATVRQWTGIPVSIGIAGTKTLAKVANRAVKKKIAGNTGVLDLTALSTHDGLLRQIAVEDVWGIGPSLSRFLKARGIETALALRDADPRWIKQQLGVVPMRTVLELRGIPCIPLELHPPSKKNICVSRGFSRPVETLAELEEAVASYATRAAEKARRGGLHASALTIFVQTNRFRDDPQYNNAASFSLMAATADTQELIQTALRGLRAIYRKGYRYAKAGVLLNDLVDAGHMQTTFFDERDRVRSLRLSNAMDRINADYGAETLHYAATGFSRTWRTKFMRRSPRFTTRWDELPVATVR